jgi:hypothetical protein
MANIVPHVAKMKQWIERRKLRNNEAPTERDIQDHINRTFTWLPQAERDAILSEVKSNARS